MKIARKAPVSGQHVEMVQPFPGSLPEGAGSPQGLTEGVSFDGSTGLMVYERFLLALKFLSGYEHRSTLPQGGSRGAILYNVPPKRRKVAGDFHRPYENSEVGTFHHSTGYTPSVSHSLDSSLREGAGRERTIHPAAQGCGRFSSPLRSSGVFTVCHSVYRPETAMFRAVVCSGYFERLTNSPKWSILPA